MYTTLIDPPALLPQLNNPDWALVDCRFSLADVDAGRRVYEESHIPGAVYAHLDDDLSGAPLTDRGRHPLPSPEAMRTLFGRLGIGAKTQVIAYDDVNGMVASRLWWMLRYMGHTAVCVLNGGWQAWQTAGLPTKSGVEENAPVAFDGAPRRDRLVVLNDVQQGLPLLVDSRAPERYRGELEPIDPKAGYIPGAVNYFYQANWGENSRYLPADAIRANFADLLGETSPQDAVFYCGSGVSACVNLLAMAHAGLEDGRLYVGSWSEWCTR